MFSNPDSSPSIYPKYIKHFFVPQAISDVTNNLTIEQEIPSYIVYLIDFWESTRDP